MRVREKRLSTKTIQRHRGKEKEGVENSERETRVTD